MMFTELNEPLHLLVVDDQKIDRCVLQARLTDVFPPETLIAEAASGSEALHFITTAERPYDCVLLDLNLPDMRGTDITSIILGLKPETTVVIITAESDMDKALGCLKSGAEDFLIKGEYTNLGLYRAIRYAIERHRASKENIRLNEALAREQALSAAQKEFIHLVSHEFRTPLAIISGASQLLAAKIPALKQSDGNPQLRKIGEAVERLESLLDNVVRLSMAEEGKQTYTPSEFDFAQAVRHTAEWFEGGRIHCEISEEPLPFYGDQRLLEYALHNIISNGLKYSPPESTVTVYVRRHAQGIECIVADQGAGMSPEAISRVGEKFYRDIRTSHIRGTGLGLHLARRFIEYHQGELSFESEPAKGTQVRLYLPISAAMLSAA